MPLPGGSCLALEIDLAAFLDLNVTLPGGVTLQAKLEAGAFPSLPGIVASLLGELNAALTPLMPFFNILDAIIALIEFSQAIPDAFGPPPNPASLIEKLEKLAKAAAKLTGLVPPLSVPIMIVGICKTIVAALMALILELEHAIQAQLKLDIARDRAASLALNPLLLEGAAELEISIDCAQADLDLAVEVGAKSLGPLNRFIDLLNAFVGLIGLDPLISIDASGNAGALLQPLKDFVEILNTFCGSIPV